jgi:hypothetical protein
MAQVVESLLSKHEPSVQTPVMKKKSQRKTERERDIVNCGK